RLQPRIPALRLSGSSLLRATATVSAGALRTAGFNGDGAKAQRSTEHRPQDHAGSAALRSDFASRPQAGAGGAILFLHVAAEDGGAGDRHRLSVKRERRIGSGRLPARRLAPGVSL